MIRNFKKLAPLLSTSFRPLSTSQPAYQFLAYYSRRRFSIFGGKKADDEPPRADPKNLDPKETGRFRTLDAEGKDPKDKTWTEAAKDTVTSAAEKVKSFVSEEPQQKSFSERAAEKIRAAASKEKAQDAAETVKEKAQGAAETIKEKVMDAKDAIKEKAREYTEAAKDRGSEEAGEYKEAAKEKAREAAEKVGEYAETAKEKGKEAAEKVRESVSGERGRDAWEHAKRSADRETPGMQSEDLKKSAEEIADKMKESKDKTKDAINAAKDKSKGVAETVVDKVKEMGEKVIDKAKSMAQGAKEKVEHVVKGEAAGEHEKVDDKTARYEERGFGKKEKEDYDEIFPEKGKERPEGIAFFSSSTYMVSINSSAEWENLKKKEKPIVVDFYQVDCAECKRIYPKLIENAKKNEGKWVLAGADMDQDKIKAVAKKLKVKNTPTVMLYHRGEIIDHVVGHDDSHLDRLFLKASELMK
jgi:thiol-disulfide isomerase/thioredoxin